MPAWDGLHTVRRRPRCTQTGTQYCGNLIWVIPAEGSGACASNFLRHAGRHPPGLRPFVFQLVSPRFILWALLLQLSTIQQALVFQLVSPRFILDERSEEKTWTLQNYWCRVSLKSIVTGGGPWRRSRPLTWQSPPANSSPLSGQAAVGKARSSTL